MKTRKMKVTACGHTKPGFCTDECKSSEASRQQSFSDADLKRLKDNLKELGDFICQECGLNQHTDFNALCERLEKAERVLFAQEMYARFECENCGAGACECGDKTQEGLYVDITKANEVWRKAKGK